MDIVFAFIWMVSKEDFLSSMNSCTEGHLNHLKRQFVIFFTPLNLLRNGDEEIGSHLLAIGRCLSLSNRCIFKTCRKEQIGTLALKLVHRRNTSNCVPAFRVLTKVQKTAALFILRRSLATLHLFHSSMSRWPAPCPSFSGVIDSCSEVCVWVCAASKDHSSITGVLPSHRFPTGQQSGLVS